MVRKSILQRFKEKEGYSLVHKTESGAWRGIAEAARATGLGEMTIRRILKEHPEEPLKGVAKYVEEFTQTEGFKAYKMSFGRNPEFNSEVRRIRKAWLALNKKDPMTWSKEDWQKIWTNPPFFMETFKDKAFHGVPEYYATPFHKLMKVTNKEKLLPIFKGKKYPKGGKREWFFDDEDIIGMCGAIEDNETLMMLGLGIIKGGRFSALVLGKPEQINEKDLIMLDYETKRKDYVPRFILKPLMELLQRYIRDYDIKPDEPLFTQGYDWFLNSMKGYARKAGIQKNVSTHILKHTFVTQAHRHGVSAEIIVEQTGTDWETLKQHYRARDEKKSRHELLGEKYDVVPFPLWFAGLMPYFTEAYERIKRSGIADGMRGRIK
jgi:integrase